MYAAGNPVNRVDPLGLDSQDDVDEAIYGCYAERAAYADAMMGTAQRGFNAALFIGQLALSMMPGGEAVILAGRLAQGADFGWDDFGYAPADLLNLGPVCRMASRFGERAT